MRILLVTPFVPHRSVAHGAATVTSSYFDYFASRHELRVLTFSYHPDDLALVRDLEGSCAHIQAVPLAAGPGPMRRARLRSLLTGYPLVVSCYDSPEMLDAIRRVLAETPVDILQADLPWSGQYVRRVDRGRARSVLMELDVAAKPLRRAYENELSPLKRWWRRREWRAMERYEPALCSEFDAVYATSREDRQLLRALNGGLDVRLFRYGVRDELLAIEPRRDCDNTLVFLGSFTHPPNVDAAVYFCESVLPRVQERCPGTRLLLVGASPPREVSRLALAPGVTVTGRVPDVGPYLAQADVGVVPLRLGGGVKLKTLEMMAAGRAIVTTPIGSEGIEATDGTHLLVAGSADDFASKVVSLLEDDSRRRRIGAEARELVRREHRWKPNLARLEEDFRRLRDAP